VSRLTDLWSDNPVLDLNAGKNIRRMWRGQKATWIVAIVSVSGLWLYWLALAIRFGVDPSFVWAVELVCITLLTPVTAYNLFSAEYEKGTWSSLALTRLTAGQVLFGKLAPRALMIMIIVLFAVTMQYAGEMGRRGGWSGGGTPVSPSVALWVQVVEVLWAGFLLALSALMSELARRSYAAVALSYGAMLLGVALVPLVASIVADGTVVDLVVAMNPFGQVSGAVAAQTPFGMQVAELRWVYFALSAGSAAGMVAVLHAHLASSWRKKRPRPVGRTGDTPHA
jgi:hypothetical protein